MSSSLPPASEGHREREIAESLLVQFTILIRSLSEEDLLAFLRGDMVLALEHRARKRSSRKVIIDEEGLIENLLNMPSADEASRYLEESGVTRKALEQVARKLDLPIFRSDTVLSLRAKIAERTVGYRSRSDAIRGAGSDKHGSP